MYEFYEEKTVKFKNKLRTDLFKKHVDNKWLICYEILTEMIDDTFEVNCVDLQPEVDTNIRIRLSKDWIDPFSLLKGSKIKVTPQSYLELQGHDIKKFGNKIEKVRVSRNLFDFIGNYDNVEESQIIINEK